MFLVASHRVQSLAWFSMQFKGTPLFLTTVETSTTSLSRISLDQFRLKAYNFEVLHKYNIMESFSQKLNLLSLELQESRHVSFFVYLIFFCIVGIFQ